MDMFEMAAWDTLRSDLHVWEKCRSTVEGCVGVVSPRRLVCPQDWRDHRTSTLSLLDILASQQWVLGQPPSSHTLTTPLVFSLKDPVAMKAYLRCLVGLDTLVSERGLRALPSSQAAEYYSCVLESVQPDLVPLGKDRATYRKLRRGAALGTVVVASDVGGDQSCTDDGVGVTFGTRSDIGQPTKRRRKGSRQAPVARRAVAPWSALVGLPSAAQQNARSGCGDSHGPAPLVAPQVQPDPALGDGQPGHAPEEGQPSAADEEGQPLSGGQPGPPSGQPSQPLEPNPPLGALRTRH